MAVLGDAVKVIVVHRVELIAVAAVKGEKEEVSAVDMGERPEGEAEGGGGNGGEGWGREGRPALKAHKLVGWGRYRLAVMCGPAFWAFHEMCVPPFCPGRESSSDSTLTVRFS